MNNREILEKAAFDLNALQTGGLQNPEQLQTFLAMVQNQPTILRDADVMALQNDRLIMDRIGFGSRVLSKATEGTPVGNTVSPTTSKVSLATQEVIAEVDLTYNMIENNILKDGIQAYVMNLLAQRAALDLEELVVNGDTASADPYLAMFDGLRKKASVNVVDMNAAALDKSVFFKAKKAMPSQYLRDIAAMRFYASFGHALTWEDQLASRQTPAAGDNAILNGTAPSAYGIQITPCANLQTYSFTPSGGSATTCSDIILTAPKNIVVGMNRDIRMEVFHDTRARKFTVTLTAKIAVDFKWADAVVKVKNIAE